MLIKRNKFLKKNLNFKILIHLQKMQKNNEQTEEGILVLQNTYFTQNFDHNVIQYTVV